MSRKLTCIICPRGCGISVNTKTWEVTGNSCGKGEEYAINECRNPVRTVTAIVRVNNRKDTMASVKTESPVPKDKMLEVIKQLRKVQIQAPVAIGAVVLENVFGTNIVVTKAVD